MLRATFLLSVLISLGLFTVLLADNSTEFKVRERRNTRGYRLGPAIIPIEYFLPIDPHCRMCGLTAAVRLGPKINGLPVSPRYKYPWIMPIAIRGSKAIICSGALINKRFVLTAAHCVRDQGFKYEFSNRCMRGSTVVSCFQRPENILVGFMGESHTKPLGYTACRRIYIHPRYDFVNDLNDIALLELQRPVPQCSKYIAPICLPQMGWNPPMRWMNHEVIVAGWDRFKQQRMNEVPQRLRESRVYEVDPVHCQMANNVELERDKIYCARRDPRNNQSSCEADSGSTVFAEFVNVFYSLGVTSTHWDSQTCPTSGVVSFASTHGYLGFIRRIAGELPSPPKNRLDSWDFSHKQTVE